MPHLRLRLWVDDIRPAPQYWLHTWNSDEAIHALKNSPRFKEMSLDHDLGGDDTSRRIILWLCENPEYWPQTVHVHTANPVGRQWLEGMITRYGPRQ